MDQNSRRLDQWLKFCLAYLDFDAHIIFQKDVDKRAQNMLIWGRMCSTPLKAVVEKFCFK